MIFQIAGWSLRGAVAALLSELLGLLMAIAGEAGVAPEFAAGDELVSPPPRGDGADRGSPVVQGVDLEVLVESQVAELSRHGDFSHRIGQSVP